MALVVPQIESRSFDEIIAETLARIPVHNPEYTNYQNNSDPGVTILQLFAFMVENLEYICNQVPDQNRLKFLSLLDIPMQPAQAATGVVTLANERGPLQTITLPSGLLLLAGSTGFVTGTGLDALPIEGQIYYRSALSDTEQQNASQLYSQLYGTFVDANSTLEFYKTVPFIPPVSSSSLTVVDLGDGSIVDGSLWLALLARQADAQVTSAVLDEIAGRTLTLGIMPSDDETERTLVPAQPASAQAPVSLIYEVATGAMDGDQPRYLRLDSQADDNPLENLTLVQLNLPGRGSIGNWTLGPLEQGVGDFPPLLEDDAVSARLITWIRIRLPQSPGSAQGAALKARFNWLGINSARVTQQIQVPAELVGTGTGEPDQIFTLANTPVLIATLQVTVDGVPWKQVDDLLAAPSEVFAGSTAGVSNAFVYTADSASGQIRFGTGLQGARAPNGSVILASYAYGGGVSGNVGIGAIRSSPQLPAGFTVSNPLPTQGGTDGESLDQAEMRIPLYLQHKDRAVSAADFTDIVESVPGINLGRVEVIPLLLPDSGVTVPGVVTLLVIPTDPNHPEGPVPDTYFLKAVCDYVEPRRLLTTEVHVCGPNYVDLSVSVGFDALPGRDIALVRNAIQSIIRDYLSPLTGGPDGTGWPLEKSVTDRELLARAARGDGLSDINDVWIWDGSGTRITSLPIHNIDLPRLTRVGANQGDPEDLTATPPPPAKTRLPVPVLPLSC
ncbi:MAG: putative baseplate assembly protein [Verrucomicrobia bacterium]|nr:putative baseplate assembly protein [Verrucomicrobiota bacterium]